MIGPYFYHTGLVWLGDRKGEIEASGKPAIQVAAPPEFHGPEGFWSPEDLFVASVCSCFMTTLISIAEASKLQITNLKIEATGKLEKFEGGGYRITEIVLNPKLTIQSSEDSARAKRILEKAERNCFISNSIVSKVTIEPEIHFDADSLQQRGENHVSAFSNV